MVQRKKSIDIVIPVYNEARELETNITKLNDFLIRFLPDYAWKIIVADNASIDITGVIGKKLANNYGTISYLYIPKKGRGRAVKQVWQNSKADYCAYMDVDLSTDLNHFIPLVKALNKGYDIAIGSRLSLKSEVNNRPLKREILSRGYNLLIKLLFNTRFSDAQCGFKAITKKTIATLLPDIQDNDWFFDSELLILAEKSGYKIYEEPVKWVDNPGSTVRVLKTVTGDIAGLWRVYTEQPWKKNNRKKL